MGFHGTAQTPTLDPFTSLTGGQTIASGADSGVIGGLSAYSELVIRVNRPLSGGAVVGVIEVVFYPSDDPTLPGQGEVNWSQFFTVPLTSLVAYGLWRIPLSAGAVKIINHSSGGSPPNNVVIFAYATQARHQAILQEAANTVPRHFSYTGALTNGGTAALAQADGLSNWLSLSGAATISIKATAAIDCQLQLNFLDASGTTATPPYTPTFTGTAAVFNDVAMPIVPCTPQLLSASAVGSVTVDAYFTPQTPG